MARRISVRVPDDIADQVVMWADRFGVTQSQLSGMAVQAGLGAILRAVRPEEAISPDILAKIIKAMNDQGVNIEELKNAEETNRERST